jgi:hypothetical protein
MKRRLLLKLLKPCLANTAYREGAVRKIILRPGGRVTLSHLSRIWSLSALWDWQAAAQRLMVNIKEGAVVYDIGANYGIHTLFMAKLVGSRARGYAFSRSHELYRS